VQIFFFSVTVCLLSTASPFGNVRKESIRILTGIQSLDRNPHTLTGMFVYEMGGKEKISTKQKIQF
jgi:hypothetical protein